jgi:surface antigen
MSTPKRRPGRFVARILVAAFAAIFGITGAIVFAPAAYAGTNDYPSKWKDKPRDSMFDSWGEYNRECTSFAAWRLHSRNGFDMPFHANANYWGAKAKALGYTVDHNPAVGSIAYWNTSSHKHVAWVEQVNPNSTVEIEQYNVGETGKYSEATIATSDPTGYIHFKDLATSFADGAMINFHSRVYVMAGGAPEYVSSWSSYGKKPSGLVTSKQWAALAVYPADGTYLTAEPSGQIYRVIGGAPIYISSWDEVGGVQPSVQVSDADIAAAGSTTGYRQNLAAHPTTSVYVTALPSKTVYQMVNGAAVPVTDPATLATADATLTIGDDDVAQAGAGTSSPFTHLRGIITSSVPTVVRLTPKSTMLHAVATGWTPGKLQFKYHWYRNGVLVKSATTTRYTLKSADSGASITVTVTAQRSNYVTTSVTSAAYVVVKK